MGFLDNLPNPFEDLSNSINAFLSNMTDIVTLVAVVVCVAIAIWVLSIVFGRGGRR